MNGLSGIQKAQILQQNINICEQNSLRCLTVTCDGYKAHLTLMEHLGAKPRLNKKDPDQSVDITMHFSEVIDHLVFANEDASHMLKNMRNTLGDKEIIFCDNPLTDFFSKQQLQKLFGNFYSDEIFEEEKKMKKRMIMWKYIPLLLHYLQEDATLHLANKISRRVVEWRENKMKMSLVFSHCTLK